MPTYQYACTACGHQLEAVQSFADDPLTECPSCEGRLRKLYSAVGIVFKGSGFYRTDSRNGKSGSAPRESRDSGAKKETSESTSSTSSSSDSKSTSTSTTASSSTSTGTSSGSTASKAAS